jgi:hypothetical protein
MTTATLNNEVSTGIDFANELRESVIAIELRKQAIGKTKVLTGNQKNEIATHFASDHHAISSSKRLFDPSQRNIKQINSILNDARSCWVNMTIAYSKGIRLIRKDQLQNFVRQFDFLEKELQTALAAADDNYAAILDSSRRYIGDQLFNERDYPKSFKGSVSIAWSIHNFEPSEELLKLAPATYRREQQRIAKQFENALINYEIEAKEQLANLCDSLLNSLTVPTDGKRQVFKEATANNLREFFNRFRTMGITSDKELNQLVAQAESALGNQTMGAIKRDSFKQQNLREKFSSIKQQLENQLIDAPLRSIDLDNLDD